MPYALRVRQAQWIRLAVGAAVIVAIALTLALNQCGCEQQAQRSATRLGLMCLVGIGFAAELLWGRWARWAFAVTVAAPVGWLIFTDNGSVAAMLLLFMVGWTVYTGSLRESLIAAGMGVIAILGYVHFDTPDRWLPWIAGLAATWLMMRLFVTQQHLVQQLRAAQADLERNAVAAERRRIASEIHDVAAHALALTVLHLTGLRLRIQREGGDPALVESVAEAERLGRRSLDDIRRTVGLLQEAGSSMAPPLPSAQDIRELVEQYRSGGLDVHLELHGEPETVTPATGLALYRIVQESLANAVKHAPGAFVRIELELNGNIQLRVRNPLLERPVRNGHGHGDGYGHGHGLGGMRERAQMLGGRLRAGPHDDGWLVECTIPGDARP